MNMDLQPYIGEGEGEAPLSSALMNPVFEKKRKRI